MSADDVVGAAQTLLDELDEVPREWWRYVPCERCRALRHEPCMQSGANWPTRATSVHARRREMGSEMHRILWLLANCPDAMLAPRECSGDS